MRVALVALIILAGTAAAADEWTLDRNEEDIKVYTRSVEGSRYREFKGMVDLKTSLASAVGVLDDTASCHEWLHLCKESRVLDQTDWSERYVYQVSNLPFPAATRDAIFKATISQNLNRDIDIELVSHPDFIPVTRYVRIRESYGRYQLQAVDDSTTRLIWTMYIDPAGSLPAFLVNRLLTDIPFNSLRNFREIVKRDKYQALDFKYNHDGQAVDLEHRSW